MRPAWSEELERDGFTLVAGIFDAAEVDELAQALSQDLATAGNIAGSIRSYGGCVYAARNILEICPTAIDVWQCDALVQVLNDTLGPEFGLVRGLYFDKPPERSWSLPWHKDLTIAVERNDLPSAHFRHPTHKAGVAHVEAPRELLREMLTLRIHLDPVTDENGPLRVIVGSHHDDEDVTDASPMQTILCQRGDVLAMRPLLSHASGNSLVGTTRHRRVLHLEFAAHCELPDGYRWHEFHRPRQSVRQPVML